MSVFAIYARNEYGDMVPTGGVRVPQSILSMVDEADVEKALLSLNLSEPVYEEALSQWTHHQQQLKADDDMEEHDMDADADDIFPIRRHTKMNVRKHRTKRGHERQARHRQFDSLKKKRVYIVENP